MTTQPKFKTAFPFRDDLLGLPVIDLSSTAEWYCKHFGMTEVQRTTEPVPTVFLERDGTRIGFAVNGGDASQDGAAILVSDIRGLKREFENGGLEIGELRTDERDGRSLVVFFVVAPDGLCYYFHEPKEAG
ncbi:VOC family protein [Rhodopirellula sallentina]|nr:VOC family protein [Rhodopirellula sallentina]